MRQDEVKATFTPPSRPPPDCSTPEFREDSSLLLLRHDHSQIFESLPYRTDGVITSDSVIVAQSYKIPSLISILSAVQGADRKRANSSPYSNLRCTRSDTLQPSADARRASTARLRGGAEQGHVGVFGWLKGSQGFGQDLDNKKCKNDNTAVKYKGKEIGRPRPTSVLDTLPPASRFARQLEDRTSLDYQLDSPLNNVDDVNWGHLPTWYVRNHQPEYELSPLSPQHPPVSDIKHRPATTNPFAGIYGNPNITRAGLSSYPVDYAAAGSLIDRPSALDGSQTGYDCKPVLPKRGPLCSSSAAADTGSRENSDVELTEEKTRNDRKWNEFPALPLEATARESVLEDEEDKAVKEDEGSFDTEEILKSLRPERLSLYLPSAPGVPVNGTCIETSTRPIHPDCISPSGAEIPTHNEISEVPDRQSIRTRAWDLQSCATDDLGVDNLFQRQTQTMQRVKWSPIPPEQQRQNNNRDNHEPLNGLPKEDAPSAESVFYAELIDIVKHYHERRRVVHRAFKAGEVSEQHYKRQVWRYGTAMDQTVRAAASMSGYTVGRCHSRVHDDKRLIETDTHWR